MTIRDAQQRTRTQAEGQHGQLEYSIACTYGHSKIENDFVAEDVCGSVLNGSAATIDGILLRHFPDGDFEAIFWRVVYIADAAHLEQK